MGANAITSVPKFQDTEALFASEITAIGGVPVFATTATRDAGFGGVDEKVLAQGQMCFVEAGNLTQYYDGAAWVTLGGGLTLITAATFSGATTASLPANSFTSAYQNYLLRLVLSGANAAGDILSLRLRAAGADAAANSYYGSSTGAQGGTTAYLSNNPATSLQLAYLSATAGRVAGDIIIRAPKEAVRTRFTHSIIGVQAGDTVSVGWVGGGFFDVATVFDAATLIGTSIIAGNYQLFGFANA